MYYTSGFHLAIKLGAALGGLLLSLLPAWLVAEALIGAGMPKKYEVVAYLVVMGAWVVIQAKLTDKHQDFFDTLAAYLYIREELETKVSFEEAKALSSLFSGHDGTWHPLTEVRKLPKDERKVYLF